MYESNTIFGFEFVALKRFSLLHKKWNDDFAFAISLQNERL